MRILHVIKATGIAGAEKHLLTLIPGLRARGVDARLIALVEPDNAVEALAHAVQDADVPFERVVICANADLSLVPRLMRVFRAYHPDIVHTHLLHADLYGIPAARLAGVRHVVTSRHNDDQFRRTAHWRMIHRLQWRMVDAGIAISDAIKAFCVEIEGAPEGKIETIRYGLSVSPPLPNPLPVNREGELAARADSDRVGRPLIIALMCRLIPQKGVIYGIDAFARLAADYPHTRLLIAGDGDLRAELEAHVRTLGLSHRVEFLGWQADIHPIMAHTDIFLMPSLWEGFGLVLLEAMSHALPIIASRVSAIPEIVIDGETGVLVAPRDADGLASAMRCLLDDSDLRARMGKAGYARLHAVFGAENMIDATLNLYHSLTRRRKVKKKAARTR